MSDDKSYHALDSNSTSAERVFELNFWMIAAIIVILFLYIGGKLSFNYVNTSENISAVFQTFIIILFFLAIPVFWRLVFGEYPLLMLRNSLKYRQKYDIDNIILDRLRSDMVLSEDKTESVALSGQPYRGGGAISTDPRLLLSKYIIESTDLSRKVYTRAGANLLAGVIIAFFGLNFFYYRSLSMRPNFDIMNHFLELIPGFGILFFIEFIAVFFLKQYRIAMDDFRYYESVRRHRQENLIILNMFAEYRTIVSPQEVLSCMGIYSEVGRLKKDESTETIEARKLHRDEILLLEKMIDSLGISRSGSK